MDIISIVPSLFTPEYCQSIIDKYNVKEFQGNDLVYFGEYKNYGIKKRNIDAEDLNNILLSLNLSPNVCDSANIVYYPEGSYNGLHMDNSVIKDGEVVRVKSWNATVIVFLNSNFNSGELVYPYQGVSIKPTIGTAVIAPAGPEFVHEVKEVLLGERYTLVLRII